jgi:hypothetical protein
VLDIADRGITKMAFVLTAEVRSVVVTDMKPCFGRIETFGEHEPPRLLKAEFLLKLQGAHGCNGFKVGMKAGDAHANLARDFLNAKRLGKILAQLSDGPNHAVGVTANRCEVAHPMALLAGEKPVDDLANDERSQNPILLGQLEQPQ